MNLFSIKNQEEFISLIDETPDFKLKYPSAYLTAAYMGYINVLKKLEDIEYKFDITDNDENNALMLASVALKKEDSNHIETIKYLIKKKIGLFKKNKFGKDAYVLSVENQNINIQNYYECNFQELYQIRKSIFNLKDDETFVSFLNVSSPKDYNQIFATACYLGLTNSVKLMMESDSYNIDYKWYDQAGNNYYLLALESQNTEIAKLLENEEKISIVCSNCGATRACHIFGKNGDIEGFKRYLDICKKRKLGNKLRNIDLQLYDIYAYAAMFGHVDMMEFLEKEHKFNPKQIYRGGLTPYLLAASSGSIEAVKYFYYKNGILELPEEEPISENKEDNEEKEEKVNESKNDEDIPSIIDCIDDEESPPQNNGYSEISAISIEAAMAALAQYQQDDTEYVVSDLDDESENENELKEEEAEIEQPKIINFGRRRKKITESTESWDKNYRDLFRKDAYMLALINGHIDLMKYLETEHSWDITRVDSFGNNAFLLAVSHGQYEVMKYLYDTKRNIVNINAKNVRGHDAYLLAIKNSDLQMVQCLEFYYNFNPFTMAGELNAYLLAAISDCPNIMKHLEDKYNWDVNTVDKNEKSALMISSINNLPKARKYLLSNPKCNLNATNKDNYTAYTLAIKFGNLETFMDLENNPNIDKTIVTKSENTPFLVAVISKNLSVIKHVEQQKHCDIHARNKYGEDAYLLAIKYAPMSIINYLETKYNWDINTKNKKGEGTDVYAKNRKSDVIANHIYFRILENNFKLTKTKFGKRCLICKGDFEEDKIYMKCYSNHLVHKECYMDNLKEYKILENLPCVYCDEMMIKRCYEM